MNLFILSLSVTECAQFMFDKHVSKIILEAAQMLCTAVNTIHPDHNLNTYRSCHLNHPVSIWVRTSLDNFLWTIDLVEAMHNEWKYRNDYPPSKLHKSYEMAMYLKNNLPPPDKFEKKGLTPFAQAMPDQFKDSDPVIAYRKYYQFDEHKRKIATWKKRNRPDWYS
uniref:Uncharacterized protein n=1 Tax=viral metagenome TaxID=1070528 RepID=A0A6C0BV19_9ZZZZ